MHVLGDRIEVVALNSPSDRKVAEPQNRPGRHVVGRGGGQSGKTYSVRHELAWSFIDPNDVAYE
jgi:hypothetical protein